MWEYSFGEGGGKDFAIAEGCLRCFVVEFGSFGELYFCSGLDLGILVHVVWRHDCCGRVGIRAFLVVGKNVEVVLWMLEVVGSW